MALKYGASCTATTMAHAFSVLQALEVQAASAGECYFVCTTAMSTKSVPTKSTKIDQVDRADQQKLTAHVFSVLRALEVQAASAGEC